MPNPIGDGASSKSLAVISVTARLPLDMIGRLHFALGLVGSVLDAVFGVGKQRRGKMMKRTGDQRLDFPFPDAPAPNELIEIAPNILWSRFALPFDLDHINIYVIEDVDGLTVIDTGISNVAARDYWEFLLSGPLRHRKIGRAIVTHYHPDHIGLAGWLEARFGVELLMSEQTFAVADKLTHGIDDEETERYREFYRSHGLSCEAADRLATAPKGYAQEVSPLPQRFHSISNGQEIEIANGIWRAVSAEGHAHGLLMLHNSRDNILLSADQVIAGITPNISLWASDDEPNPLQRYIDSLELLLQWPEATLVLPSHKLPFRGLRQRASALIAHHQERCAVMKDACAKRSLTASELTSILFPRQMDPFQRSFAFTETLAHVIFMQSRGDLTCSISSTGVKSFHAT